MLKKISTFLFLVIYSGVSLVSFADEVVLEVVVDAPIPVVETISESVVEYIPEEIVSETPVVAEEVVSESVVEYIPEEIVSENPVLEEVLSPVISGDVLEGTGVYTPVSQEIIPSQEGQVQNVPESIPIDDIIDILNVAPEERTEEIIEDIPTTEELPTTTLVEVEENSIFTPPGPEPEPWQPAVVQDPTTDNIPIGDTATQSDTVFLSENSIFTRRFTENVMVDPTAKHTCKVDIFRTDISDMSASLLSVKFYGTSHLASYDAEIGSLPNGIDVRFEKNHEYLYDFRGKETTLELVVNKQDGSLSGDFTIPIIFTHKGKKESSVICQLNLINDEEEAPLVPPVVPIVEPVSNPSEEFAEEILDLVSDPEPIMEAPTTIEEILEVVTDNSISDISNEMPSVIEKIIPEAIPSIALPIEIPAAILPEIQIVPESSQEIDMSTGEPLSSSMPDIPSQENMMPVIEVPLVADPPLIPLSDVSSA